MHRKEWLAKVINERGYRYGVELGVKCGETADYVLSNCPCLEMWTGIDLWSCPPGNPEWNHASNKADAFEVMDWHPFRMVLANIDTAEAASKYTTCGWPVNLVFVDASHDAESVRRDIEAWLSLIHPGGMICGHDWSKVGVRQGVQLGMSQEMLERLANEAGPNVWWVEV